MQIGKRSSVGVGSVTIARVHRLGLVASALLLTSTVMQLAAAAQRWAPEGAPPAGAGLTMEDHVFDYVLPAEVWVSVGSSAGLFGASQLIIAAAVLCIATAGTLRTVSGVAMVSAALAAAAFALVGAHALASGLLGEPSVAEEVVSGGALLIALVQVAALLVFAASTMLHSPLWSIAIALLSGTSFIGYLFATTTVAPILLGHRSHDTNPWSEAVLAAFTGAAALAVAAGSIRRSDPVSTSRPSRPLEGRMAG